MGEVNKDIVYQIYLFIYLYLDVCSFKIIWGKFKKIWYFQMLYTSLQLHLIYYQQIWYLIPDSLNPEITHNNKENCSETETQDNPLTSWQILSGSGTLLITSLQSDSA